MSISEADLISKLSELLIDRLHEEGYPEFEIFHESRPSEFLPPKDSHKKFSDLSFSADLIVVKEMDWIPSELDEIENLERWFPTDTIRVPVAIIELKREVGFNDIHGSNFKFGNLRLWNTSQKYDGILGVLVNYDSVDQLEIDGKSVLPGANEVEIGHSMRRGNFILQVSSNIDVDWLQDSVISPIMGHIESINDKNIVDVFSLEDIVNELDPGIFHLNEVIHAYRNNRNQILVVLLSVFFESYVNELISEHMSELKGNINAGDIYKDWNFYSALNACRFFGIIEENDYELINKIRDARNTYTHEFVSYHTNRETSIEQEKRINEAIQLYENIIGVRDSMVE